MARFKLNRVSRHYATHSRHSFNNFFEHQQVSETILGYLSLGAPSQKTIPLGNQSGI